MAKEPGIAQKRLIFPTLRCAMGDWIYYVTFLTLTDVAQWIRPTDEIHRSKRLSDYIQRRLDEDHAGRIARYLLTQEQRLFSSIVVGVYGGKPNWVPVKISDPRHLLSTDDESQLQRSMGLLSFAGNESLFAIDGQHRVAGIKRALEEPNAPKTDEISVILVGHDRTEAGQARTRRLFTTLNKTAKKVSARDIISLDEDNGFAVVTRRLVDDFALFQEGQWIAFGPTSNIGRDDNEHVASLIGLYEITKDLYPRRPPQLPAKRVVLRSRPSDRHLDAIFEINCNYWTLLAKEIPPLRDVFLRGTSPGNYRDHLLFRTAGQRAFASAVEVLVSRGATLRQAVQRLRRVEMNLESDVWRNILWDPAGNTMIPKHRVFAETRLLQEVGEQPRSWDAGEKFRRFLEGLAEQRGKVEEPRAEPNQRPVRRRPHGTT